MQPRFLQRSSPSLPGAAKRGGSTSNSGISYQFILRVLWICACLTVIVGSLLPSSSSPMRAWSALHIADKLQHFTAYAVLAFLPTLHERRPTFVGIALGIIAMGVCLEFGQRLSEGRFFEIGDMAANTGGVLTGLILGLPSRSWMFARVRNSRPSRV